MASTEFELLPYERIHSRDIQNVVDLRPGEHLLILQPFGWHLDGKHIPNAPEQTSREGLCHENGWEVVCDFGPYVAVVREIPEPREWLIYNGQNGQFWGPDSGGYFGLWGAGLYPEKEARQLASNKDRMDRVYHISEYKDQIANMRGAFERLHAALVAAAERTPA